MARERAPRITSVSNLIWLPFHEISEFILLSLHPQLNNGGTQDILNNRNSRALSLWTKVAALGMNA